MVVTPPEDLNMAASSQQSQRLAAGSSLTMASGTTRKTRRSSQSTHRNTETHSAPGSPKFERKFPITTTTAITTITSTAATPAAPTATATAANTACSLNSPQQQQQLLFSENVIVQQNDSKHFQNQQSTIYQQQQSSQDQESNGQHERMYHQNSASSVISTCSNSTAGGVTTTGNLEGTTGNISSNNGSAAGNTSISGVREQKISTGSISNKSGSEAISPAVAAAAAAAANDDSESDLEQFTGNRSRQKKFIKNFKQLPQEEVVLQRYSCALVSDILLQGHLYITENYFAFHSNVFGYVTRLQIPVRSVTKITKEKTAKIIPNAVGVCTEDEVKHIFASLLSRDTTFKLMTRLWKRTVREAGRILEEEDPDLNLMLQGSDAPEPVELEDMINDELTTDSELDVPHEPDRIPTVADVSSLEKSYVVKRIKEQNGTVYYQPAVKGHTRGLSDSIGHNFVDIRRTSTSSGNGGLLGHLSKSTIMSVFVILLLVFLFCSSLYLVFRIDALQRQVESRYANNWQDTSDSVVASENSEHLQKVLDDNVEQISSVRKSLEKLSDVIHHEQKGRIKDEN